MDYAISEKVKLVDTDEDVSKKRSLLWSGTSYLVGISHDLPIGRPDLAERALPGVELLADHGRAVSPADVEAGDSGGAGRLAIC